MQTKKKGKEVVDEKVCNRTQRIFYPNCDEIASTHNCPVLESDTAALAARLDKLEKWMVQYTRIEESREAAFDALATRQDLLEQVAEEVWAIAGKERLALAERVEKLEQKPKEKPL